MSGMTVGEVLDHYLSIIGEEGQASREKYTHLNNGYRLICNRIDLPELHVPNAEVSTVAAQDYVEHDCGAYSIDWIVDKSTSQKLYPEPDGMRGRALFYEDTTGMPPQGNLFRYVRQGNRIYLRDTPKDVRTLIIAFRTQPPTLDSSSLSGHLLTPEQYDMAVVYAAAASYLKSHPPMIPGADGVSFVPDRQAWREMDELMKIELGEQKDPMAEENRDRRQTITLRGYSFSVGGR